VGVFYYTSQICLQAYQETISHESYDSKKLYVFAYAFSLAELTGFFLNICILIFNLTHIFSFISWLMSFFLMLPVLILVMVLKLSVFKVVKPTELSLVTFFKLFLEAVVETVKNHFAYDAWKELWADYNGQE
jgi:alpha-mannosidase